jgi:nitrite reductase/ring-hydroxylating ferredoxin subunit
MSDEATVGLARIWATPAGVKLGPLEQIADPGARSYVLRIGDKRFHGFVARRGGAVFGYVDRCPHAGLPLAQVLDQYLTQDGGLISCSWHGALFEVASGACVGGPCVGARLSSWPVRVEDGRIVTG